MFDLMMKTFYIVVERISATQLVSSAVEFGGPILAHTFEPSARACYGLPPPRDRTSSLLTGGS